MGPEILHTPGHVGQGVSCLLENLKGSVMSLSTTARSLLSCILVYAILASTIQSNFAPVSWGQSSFCIWLLFALSKGWTAMQRSDRYHLCWGWLSVAAFISFVGVYDTSFKVLQRFTL